MKMNTFRKRLEEAKRLKKKVKIVFEYPNAKSAKIRRGIVKNTNSNAFELIDVKDGSVIYSYKYIAEIKWEN